MIHSTTFVVVDTETTGSTAAQDRVIEIGAVKVRAGKILDTYQTFLNPERFIPHNVMQIHNISDMMVKDAPTFGVIADELLSFMGEESIFTAHNVEFDREFLNYEFQRIGYPRLIHQPLCTLKLARKLFPDFKKHNLVSLAETLRIPHPHAHRALDDSITTARILLLMFDQLSREGKTRLEDINLKSPLRVPSLSLFQ